MKVIAKNIVDLRSDTVTQPTEQMRLAMSKALVGDDVFGDDPSVNALQERVAHEMGKEAALFMSSGTQSNLCAILAHCQRGDEYIVGQMAHTYRYEAGGAAVLGSVQPQPLTQDSKGQMSIDDMVAALKPDDAHFARTRLLCLENTWNGQPMSAQYIQQSTDWAKSKGLACHLDGARVFNAAVHDAGAEGDVWCALREIVNPFDSVSICFSKGLAAPFGSMLCGTKDLIAKAHRIRKMVGGGLRQAGILAAAADHALTHHLPRLHKDHKLAALLDAGMRAINGVRVRSVATNIVFIDVANGRGQQLLSHLKSNHILATGMIGLRFVTHQDVDVQGIERTINCVQDFMQQA